MSSANVVVDRLSRRALCRDCQLLSSFTVFPSLLLSPRSTASCCQIADKIRCQLSILASLGSSQRLHDLLVMVNHLPLFPRQTCLTLLAIEHLRLRRPIMEVLNLPPFVRGAMNPARGGGLNAMFPQGLRKPLSPALQIRFSRIQTDPIETGRLHRQVDMWVWGRVRIRIGLERVENHRVLKTRELSLRKVTGRSLD